MNGVRGGMRLAGTVVLGLMTLLSMVPRASADFELPILYEVPKIISVSENMDPGVLRRLGGVENLTLEIHLEGGNMIRDQLVRLLAEVFPDARIRLVLGQAISKVHVEQLRRLGRFEVAYPLLGGSMDSDTFNHLFALGPVRKHLIIAASASEALLDRVSRLKYTVPHVVLGPDGLDDALRSWLRRRPGRGVCFALPPGADADLIYPLLEFKPLTLVIPTDQNRIPGKLEKILKDLRGVDLVLLVDGSLTLADVKTFAALERFSLKVDLTKTKSLTPGLGQLLNRVRPPSPR